MINNQIHQPLVTVLMPVFNGANFLADSIESVLTQTFKDFELLIIDDKSTDNSLEIARSFSDVRLKIICSNRNKGPSAISNLGIKLAQGKYIARLDCDDLSLPNRLQTQVSFMENNKDVILCGSFVQCFDGDNEIIAYPLSDAAIRCMLLFNSTFIHSSTLIRKEIFLSETILYNENLRYAEDYDLWARIPSKYKMANLPKVLVKYRKHNTQASFTNKKSLLETADEIRTRMVKNLDIQCTKEELYLHCSLAKGKFEISKNYIEKSILWCKKILNSSEHNANLNYTTLEECLLDRLSVLFFSNRELFPWKIYKYITLPFSKKALFTTPFKMLVRLLHKHGFTLKKPKPRSIK